MRTEELIKAVSALSSDNGKFEELKKGLPLGIDASGNIMLAQKREKPLTIRNTCVTGAGKTNFIRRFLITVSCLYDKEEACFFILSPRVEYGDLLRLHSADITVPYIRNKQDLSQALETLKELMHMRAFGKGYPHLFLILDGLDELEGSNVNSDLSEYREIFDMIMRKPDIDVICGADLARSIFSGYPGAFLGVGNCFITTREEGKADVTYVNDDSGLTLPAPITYPAEPSITESIIFLNSLPN